MANTKKMKKAKATTIYLDEKDYVSLKNLAWRGRTSMADLIRIMVRNYIDQYYHHGAIREKTVKP